MIGVSNAPSLLILFRHGDVIAGDVTASGGDDVADGAPELHVVRAGLSRSRVVITVVGQFIRWKCNTSYGCCDITAVDHTTRPAVIPSYIAVNHAGECKRQNWLLLE